MGKKKGKGGGKKGRKIVDGISTAEMSKEQLVGHIKRLQAEIGREREERNFFMLEREKLFSLWSLSLEKIRIEKDKARLAEIQRDDAREAKEAEINDQKQKTRFLMSEHLKKLGEARLDYLQRMKLLQDEFWKTKSYLKETNQDDKKQLKNAKLCLFETVSNLQLQHSQNISSLRNQYLKEVVRIEVESDLLVRKEREIIDLESKQDLIQIQTIKDDEIHQLIRNHEEQLEQLREYYSEITVNNLAIIQTLQEELQVKKANGEKLERELGRSKLKCQEYTGRIQELQDKMVTWSAEEKQMANRIKQVQQMDRKVEMNQKQIKSLENLNEALIQKNMEANGEVDILKRSLAKTIMEMQMKTTMSQILFQIDRNKNKI